MIFRARFGLCAGAGDRGIGWLHSCVGLAVVTTPVLEGEAGGLGAPIWEAPSDVGAETDDASPPTVPVGTRRIIAVKA